MKWQEGFQLARARAGGSEASIPDPVARVLASLFFEQVVASRLRSLHNEVKAHGFWPELTPPGQNLETAARDSRVAGLRVHHPAASPHQAPLVTVGFEHHRGLECRASFYTREGRTNSLLFGLHLDSETHVILWLEDVRKNLEIE